MRIFPSWAGLKLRAKLLKRVLTRPANLYAIPVVTVGPLEFLRPLLPGLPTPPPDLLARQQPDDPTSAVVESSEPAVAQTLYTLAKLLAARRVVEVGVFRGYTSEYLAAALPQGGELHLLDLSATALECGRLAADRHGIPARTYLGSSTDPVTARLVPDDSDLVYLDADHSEAGVRQELALWFPKVRVGGLLAIHDTIHYNGICQAVNELAGRHPAFTFATPRGCGLTVLRRTA